MTSFGAMDSPSTFFKCMYDPDVFSEKVANGAAFEETPAGPDTTTGFLSPVDIKTEFGTSEPDSCQHPDSSMECKSVKNGSMSYTSGLQNATRTFHQSPYGPGGICLDGVTNGTGDKLDSIGGGKNGFKLNGMHAAAYGRGAYDALSPVNFSSGSCDPGPFEPPGSAPPLGYSFGQADSSDMFQFSPYQRPMTTTGSGRLSTHNRRLSDAGSMTPSSTFHEESKYMPVPPGHLFSGPHPNSQPSVLGDIPGYNPTRFDLLSKDSSYGGDSGPNTPNSTSSSTSNKQFVPCKVCGDKASGYHYGVTSCEGCKGFFRRSIQKQIEYRCLREGKCVVYRLNRNRCQYCRFKKCLAVGMSRDSVRYGRVPKRRDRMQDDARVSSMTGDIEDPDQEKKNLDLYDVILSVSQAHHQNCLYTEDKIKNLQQHPMIFPLDSLGHCSDPVGSTDMLERRKIIMWETLAQHITPEIQRVVEFAKRIPGTDGQIELKEVLWNSVSTSKCWLIRSSRMFHAQSSTLTLADGQYITRDQMEIMFNPEVVNLMFQFSVALNSLHLNDGEIGLFSAIVLLSGDRPNLGERAKVEHIQEKIIEALKLQLTRSHSADPGIFPTLLVKITGNLKNVGEKHNEVLGWYRMNWAREKLPPLFAEIYDIPKSPEEDCGLASYPGQIPSSNGRGSTSPQSPVCSIPQSSGLPPTPLYPELVDPPPLIPMLPTQGTC